VSEIRDLIEAGMLRLLADRWDDAACRRNGTGWPDEIWQEVNAFGLGGSMVSEGRGGAGLTFGDGLTLIQAISRHPSPLPLPLSETLVAGYLLDQAELDVADGVVTLASVNGGDDLAFAQTPNGSTASGTLHRVPWAGKADHVVAPGRTGEGEALALIDISDGDVVPGANLAGEPRDTITLVRAPVRALASMPGARDVVLTAGAAARTAQIAGVTATVLAQSVDFANTRVQFGRPIGKLQAVQQNLAVMAGHAAAAVGAAALVASPGVRPRDVAFAKSRASEAAGVVVALAHQTFGAIGFTEDYGLHRLTKRLLSWQDEFGAASFWNRRAGRELVAAGGAQFWRQVSGT
jgi:acyl-CoA dehydrogenase